MDGLFLLALLFATASSISADLQMDGAEIPLEFEPVGCFKDTTKKPRPLPELIKNFRFPDKLDWSNLNKTIADCAKEVKKKGYKYFGLQFYGECWSGPAAQDTYNKYGASKKCVAGVGMGFANFVYKLKEELPPECSESNYAVLDSLDRAMSERTLSLKPCDYTLKPGWYRFRGKAGNGMANACVKQFYCGTIYTGWLRGSHPTVQEGVVTREGCFNKYGNCCSIKVSVQVRNCGPFYLYKLPAAPTCQLRYCGNGQE